MVAKDFKPTLEEIKKLGYWRVNFYPPKPNPSLIGHVSEGKQIVRNDSVNLRGWDYPHFPTESNDHQDVYVIGDKVEAWVNWEHYREVWRIYQSGQFIHYFGLREDRRGEDSLLPEEHPHKKIVPGSVLEVIGAIYSLTEIFVFLKNLTENGLYDNGVVVEISLRNTKGRVLHISDPMRAPLFMEYKSRGEDINLPKRTYTKSSVVKNYLKLALDTIINLFHQFNWDNPPMEVIKEDQKKLMERRI